MIKAILTKPVSFYDMQGKPVTLNAGIEVSIFKDNFVLVTDLNGKECSKNEGYIAIHGNDTFDISSNEFKTFD